MVDFTIHYMLGLGTIGSFSSVYTGACGSFPSANRYVCSNFPTYSFRVQINYVPSDTTHIIFTFILQNHMMSWSGAEIIILLLLLQAHKVVFRNFSNPKVLDTNMDFKRYPWKPVLMIILDLFSYSFFLIWNNHNKICYKNWSNVNLVIETNMNFIFYFWQWVVFLCEFFVNTTIHYILALCTIGSLPYANTYSCGSLPSANIDACSTFPTYIFRVEIIFVLSDTENINFICIL